MKFISLFIFLIGGLFSFNSYALDCSKQIAANGPFSVGYVEGNTAHYSYNGCDIIAPTTQISYIYNPPMISGLLKPTGLPYKLPADLVLVRGVKTVKMSVVNDFTYSPAQCLVRPPLLSITLVNYWTGSDDGTYAYYDGCEYKSRGVCVRLPSGNTCDWYPTGRVKPSLTGSGSGVPSGTGGTGSGSGTGNGSGSGTGTGWGSGSGSGSNGGGSGGSGGTGITPSTGGGTGWGSGVTSGTAVGSGGSGGSGASGGTDGDSVLFPSAPGPYQPPGFIPVESYSDSCGKLVDGIPVDPTICHSSGSGSGSDLVPNFGVTSHPGKKPGDTVTTFTQPLPAPVPYGEPTAQEIKNYAKDFFIYNKECGNSCLDYFDRHQPPFTPVGCMDLAFNLHVPHKKPDCRSNDIAWFDKDGNFIEFKYRLTDKARHDIINKLKGDFSSGGSAPFYPGVSKLPLPVEVTNLTPNYFNTPTSPRHNYLKPGLISIGQDYAIDSGLADNVTPFELLSLIHFSTRDANLNLSHFYSGSMHYNTAILSELEAFHTNSNYYGSKILDRLNTDNIDSTASDSVSKLSSNLMGLLNGQNVGGDFSEASSLMAQIGNGSDSPLLGKFLDNKLIPIVDTRRCDMPVFGRGTEWEFTFNSVYLYKLKQILTYIMYALTFWYLFDMLTNVGGRD